MKKINILLVSAAVVSASIVHAEQMRISTPVGFDARNSAGEFLSEYETGTYTFAVGGFSDGFVPTSDNFSAWSENWIAVKPDATWRASGLGGNRVFSGFVQNNEAANGLTGYVWAFDQVDDLATAEWALIGNDNWVIPAFNDLGTDLLPANDWVIGSDGSFAVFGSVSADSMQLQAIPEPSTYALIFGLGILGFLGYRRVRK